MTPIVSGETLLYQSAKTCITLTPTHIIHHSFKDGEFSYEQIDLNKISGCESKFKHSLTFLISTGLGLVILSIAAMLKNQELFGAFGIATTISGLLYYSSRQKNIILSSAGSAMQINVYGMKNDKLTILVRTIERAAERSVVGIKKKAVDYIVNK